MKNTQFYIKRHWLFVFLIVFGINIFGSASSDKLDLLDLANNLVKDNGLMKLKYAGYYKFYNAKKKPFKGKRYDLTFVRGTRGDGELSRAINKKDPRYLKVIAGNYKIHLMPKKGEEEGVIKKLFGAASELGNIYMIKFKEFPNQGTSADDWDIKPKVVIYPATGKENAQKVLNKVYELFEGTEGTNVKPRYNTKVTSLIWIAQGDGDAKIGYSDYFGPARVYYNPEKMGDTNANYYLKHPETGKDIVPTEEDIEEIRQQEENAFISSSSSTDSDFDDEEDVDNNNPQQSSSSSSSLQLRIKAPQQSTFSTKESGQPISGGRRMIGRMKTKTGGFKKLN